MRNLPLPRRNLPPGGRGHSGQRGLTSALQLPYSPECSLSLKMANFKVFHLLAVIGRKENLESVLQGLLSSTPCCVLGIKLSVSMSST